MAAEKTKRKVQVNKVEILLSVYCYKDKPVSVIGIKNTKTHVGHDISKTSLPADGWFGVASYIKTMPRMLDEVRSDLINKILSNENKVHFPILQVADLPDYADLKHTIVKKLIEVG